MGRYRQLASIAIADAAVELEACLLDELFHTAAVALADLQVDPSTIAATTPTTIAPVERGMLHEW